MFGANLSQIIEGHVNELMQKEQELSKERMAICKQCVLCTEGITGPICDGSKCWDTKDAVLTTRGSSASAICGCGCRLLAKTTLKNARCVLGKW